MMGRCAGLADLSDVAVLNRLRHAEAWLGHLLDRWFVERGIGTTLTGPPSFNAQTPPPRS